MCIHTVMSDLPDLSSIIKRANRSCIKICGTFDNLNGRTGIAVDYKLIEVGTGDREFKSKHATHPSIPGVVDFTHFVLQCLWFNIQCNRWQ